jgi:lipopolysaccharide export system protein LptA
MARSSIRVALFAAAILAGAPALVAQVETAKPIKVKAPKVKLEKFKGQVVHFSATQMTVQSTENTYFVRTFKFSGKVAEQMQKIADRGGFQPGDTVEVHFEPGSDVAVRVKGKPSKPL